MKAIQFIAASTVSSLCVNAQFVAPPSAPTHNTSSSIAKVIKLLTKLRKDVETDEKKDDVMYDKFACYCDKEKSARGQAIEDNKNVIVEQSTIMTVSKREIKSAESVIAKMVKEIAAAENEQKEQKSMLDKERTGIADMSGQQTETMNVLKSAIGAVTKGKKSKSFLEIDTSTKQALSLVETMTGKAVGVSENSMGAAQGYLTELYKQTSIDLQQGSKQLLDAITVYNQAILLSMKKKAGAQKEKNIQEKVKAEKEDVFAAANEAYNTAVKELKIDSKFFDSLEEDCQTRADFHRAQQASRGEEKLAIDNAVEILKSRNEAAASPDAYGTAYPGDSYGGSDSYAGSYSDATMYPGDSYGSSSAPTSFLQTAMKKGMNTKVHSVSVAISKLTKENKEKVLNLLQTGSDSESDIYGTAENDTESGCENKEGAVAKLVCTCENMIGDLRSEVDEIKATKDECKSTSHTLASARSKAEDVREAAADALSVAESELQVAQEEVVTAQKKVADSAEMQTKLENECSATENNLHGQINVNSLDLAALDDAIQALAATYGVEAVAAQADGEHYHSDGKLQSRDGQASTDFADARKTRTAGNLIVDILTKIRTQVQHSQDSVNAELDELLSSCKTQRGELSDIAAALEEAFVDATNTRAEKNTSLEDADIDLYDAELDEEERIDEQEEYGNCATKIDEFNASIEAKEADVMGLESVISFLGDVDTDFRSL